MAAGGARGRIVVGIMAVESSRLSDRAYELLRDRIVRLELPPLAALSEKALSEELDIGIQPVREAVRRLEQDHLVTIFPRRGTFVAEVGVRDERRISEIRIEIEGLCAELAASRATDAECEELLRIAGEHLEHPGNETIDADARFHREMYRIAHNHFLEKTLNQYYNLSLRTWHYCASQQELPQETVEPDHLRTAEAIRGRNGEQARTLAREHIVRSSHKLAALLEAERLSSHR